jgi:hypothetical protein
MLDYHPFETCKGSHGPLDSILWNRGIFLKLKSDEAMR